MQATAILNAPRHRTRLAGKVLGNERLELNLLPELGCHWTRLRLSVKGDWVDFLKPAADGDALLDRPTGHGCYVLAPWSNRIPGGVFQFGGKPYEIQPNFDDGSAIHGDVRLRPWNVLRSDDTHFEATLETHDFDDFNYPFALRFQQTIALCDDRLDIALTTENTDQHPAPVGLGFHPYFLRRPSWRDEDVMVVLPAEKYYPLQNCLPTAPSISVLDDNDLRAFRPLGNRHIDDCYTGLTDREIRLIYPGSRVEIRFELDDNFSHVIVHAPHTTDGTPSSFVAVEPLTHVTNAFNLQEQGWQGTGVKVLDPGERWTARWSISVGDI